MSKIIRSYRDLKVYQSAFGFQQDIFSLSKKWPLEEKYALKDQIRRSSRSIGVNIAEAWGKRRYPAHFESKLSDADGELQETQHWLVTALDCRYIAEDDFNRWTGQTRSIGKKMGAMISKSESFCRRACA